VNNVVVHVEGRRSPGLVVQGDRLQEWLRLASVGDFRTIELLAYELEVSMAEYTRICELFGDDDADDELPDPLASRETMRVSLMARWDFVVRDDAAFLQYARQRFMEAHPEVPEDVDEHVGEVSGALAELFHLDLGDFDQRYEAYGAEQAGSGYTVNLIGQTLWEMTGAQREIAGF
jgi:hypothetical protein